MTTSAITIHSTFLPHEDPEESLAFYRDLLGFEVRLDVGGGTMRWITLGPADETATAEASLRAAWRGDRRWLRMDRL